MLPNQADPPALSILPPHFHLDLLLSVREDSGVALVMPRALSPMLMVVHTVSRFDCRSPHKPDGETRSTGNSSGVRFFRDLR